MEKNSGSVPFALLPDADPFDGTESLARSFVETWRPGMDVSSDAFVGGPEPLMGASNETTRRHILRTLGVINVTVGRNGPARVALDALDIYPRVLKAARMIWEKLQKSDGRLSPDEISSIVRKSGCRPDRAQDPVNLVKQLGLAVGVQRAGGLRRTDLATKEAVERLSSLQSVPSDEEVVIEEAQLNWERESTYYEFIATLVDSWDGYEAAIVGGQQIGRGEWSTPDIVAISVETAPSLVVPIVRVVTVEVKFEVSRLAIAEAAAHKRFAHYAYVGTPQAPIDMDPLIVAELAAAGVGLICPRQRESLTFHVYLEAQLNRPDEEDVEQLLQRFRTPDGRSMSKVTHDRVRTALSVLFAP